MDESSLPPLPISQTPLPMDSQPLANKKRIIYLVILVLLLLVLILFLGYTFGGKKTISSAVRPTPVSVVPNNTPTPNPSDSFHPVVSQIFKLYPMPTIIPTPDSMGHSSVPAYYVSMQGTKTMTITNSKGQTYKPLGYDGEFEGQTDPTIYAQRIPTIMQYAREIPGVSNISSYSNISDLAIYTDDTYTLSLGPETEPIELTISYGIGNGSNNRFKMVYTDLLLDSKATLTFSPQGVTPISVNGKILPPTAAVTGAQAADNEAPEIDATMSRIDSGVVVSLKATDAVSKVTQILYSLDNTHFTVYEKPFIVKPGYGKVVYAFADDDAGNRSGPQEFPIK